jgi:hypothetical protein
MVAARARAVMTPMPGAGAVHSIIYGVLLQL